MKIYTGIGDRGFTRVFGGIKLPKDHLLLETLGSLDELSSLLGYARSKIDIEGVKDILRDVQRDIFRISTEIICLYTPIPGRKCRDIEDVDIRRIESYIDDFSSKLPPLNKFIMVGGSSNSALLHYARSVCRRIERVTVRFFRSENIMDHSNVIAYLNRLSDLLFVMARYINIEEGYEEEYMEV
jgi:cob(I)alamin adenosyltransferase